MDKKKSSNRRVFLKDTVEFKAYDRLSYAEEFTSDMANQIIEDASKKNTLGMYILKAQEDGIKLSRKNPTLLGKKAPKNKFSYESIKLIHLFSAHPQIICMVTTDDGSPSYEMLMMSSSEKVDVLKMLILNAKDNGERINPKSLDSNPSSIGVGSTVPNEPSGYTTTASSRRTSTNLPQEDISVPEIYDPNLINSNANEMRESRIVSPMMAVQDRRSAERHSYDEDNGIADYSHRNSRANHVEPIQTPEVNSVRRSIIDDPGRTSRNFPEISDKDSSKIRPDFPEIYNDNTHMAQYEMTDRVKSKSSTIDGTPISAEHVNYISERLVSRASIDMKSAMERFQKAQYDDESLPSARHRFYSPVLDKVSSSDAYLTNKSPPAKYNFIPAMYATSDEARNSLTRPKVFELEGGMERSSPNPKVEKPKSTIVDNGVWYRVAEVVPEYIKKTQEVKVQSVAPKPLSTIRSASLSDLTQYDDQTVYLSNLQSGLRAFSSKNLVEEFEENPLSEDEIKMGRESSPWAKKKNEKDGFVLQYVARKSRPESISPIGRKVSLNEGIWNCDFQRLSKMPEGSTLLDPNGSVYVFVAHKKNQSLVRKLECASSDDEDYFDVRSSRKHYPRPDARRI